MRKITNSCVYLVIGICLLISCRNKKTTSEIPGVVFIDIVNPISRGNDNLISEYEIIPLEVNDSCLIKSIHQLHVTDSFIYVSDGRMGDIFIFDSNGKFVNAIQDRGTGNNEYVSINSFDVDVLHQRLILSDSFSRRIFLYDMRGNQLKTLQLNFPPVRVVADKNGYFLNLYGGSNLYYEEEELEKHHIHVIDSLGNVVQVLLSDQTRKRLDISSNQTENRSLEGNLLYNPVLSDTIYEISTIEMSCYPQYVFNNRSSYKIPSAKERNKMECVYGKRNDLEIKEKENYLISWGGFLDAENSMFFSFGWDRQMFLFYFKQEKGSIMLLPDKLQKEGNSVEKVIFWKAPYTTNDDWYYTSIDGMEASILLDKLEDGRLKDRLQEMLEQDNNPILVRYKVSLR